MRVIRGRHGSPDTGSLSLSDYHSQVVGGQPVWQYVDANPFSLYPAATYGDRTGGPEDAMTLLELTRKRLAAAGVPASMPIWATEINDGLTGPPSAAAPISERDQVANVIRTYVLGALRGLARIFWYRSDWKTLAAALGGGTLGNTLLSVPGSPDQITQAGQALGTAQQWLQGRLLGIDGRQPCARDRSGTYTCVVRYAAGRRTILWNPQHDVTVSMPSGASRL